MLTHSPISGVPLYFFSAALLLASSASGQPPPPAEEEEQQPGEVAPAEVTPEEGPGQEPPPPADTPEPAGQPEVQAAAPAAPAAEPPPAPPPAAEAEAEATVVVGTEGAGAAAAAAEEEEAVIVGTIDSPATRGGVEVGAGDWEFGYHGFFRAPMRLGIGKRYPPYPATEGLTTDQAGTYTAGDYSETTYHVPLVPDAQYVSWQHTTHSMTDWAEMFFSVGNPYARGTLAIEGYNFTIASYSMPEQQFGISQGYVEIMPELPYQNVRLRWKVGALTDRYGMAGRYDMGEYETYLIGRTMVYGETLRAEIDVSEITLAAEHGLGTHRPDASQFNTSKFTLLHHGHGFLEHEGLMLGLHYLRAWSQEEDREATGRYINTGDGAPPDAPNFPAGYGYISEWGVYGEGAEGAWALPDGSMQVIGAEVKYDAGPYGLGYLGFAQMKAEQALTVGPALEWLHAKGGGVFNLGVTNNYLDNPRCQLASWVGTPYDATQPAGQEGGPARGCSSGGTGTVNSLLFQYEFSVANLLQGLEDGTTFWGDGMDFKAIVYGMYNKVTSNYDASRDFHASPVLDASGAPIPANTSTPYQAILSEQKADYYSDHSKLKYGANLLFNAYPALGVGTRIDRVQPNNHMPEQSFTILSPRLEFRSRWVTREKIIVQYSRYMYAQRQCAIHPESGPYDPTVTSPNRTGLPVDQRCAQPPSTPRPPEGWGSMSQNLVPFEERGQPVAGGNPNAVRPDVDVIQIAAQMWW